MSADLSIHVFEGITEKDIARFFSNALGSKHFSFFGGGFSSEAYDKISNTPQCWIGEVSWLKAGLLDDADTFIPGPIQKISELIGEDLPELTDELAVAITEALTIPNATDYHIATPEEVNEFLHTHMGKKLFTVSW